MVVQELAPEEKTRFVLRESNDIAAARAHVRHLAVSLGFGRPETLAVIAAVTELGRNIIQHAGCGEIHLSAQAEPPSVVIEAMDKGPGIPDAETRSGPPGTEEGGLGLLGVQHLMDEFEIRSGPDTGTYVLCKKFASHG